MSAMLDEWTYQRQKNNPASTRRRPGRSGAFSLTNLTLSLDKHLTATYVEYMIYAIAGIVVGLIIGHLIARYAYPRLND